MVVLKKGDKYHKHNQVFPLMATKKKTVAKFQRYDNNSHLNILLFVIKSRKSHA